MSGIGGAWAAWKARTARERRQWYALLVIAGLLIPVLGVPSGAEISNGFEIDANQYQSGDTDPGSDWREIALYAGNNGALTSQVQGNDWVAGGGESGVFTTTASGSPLATDCYGSNSIYKDPGANGVAAFICDGNGDSKFSGKGQTIIAEPDNNIVSPAGKSNDGSWPIKPGSPKGKNDFSHAYVYAETGDSPCDGTGDTDDLFLRIGGHRGDAEGDATWGFEFLSKAPTNFANLKNNSATNYNLVYDRDPGDLLIVFDVKSGGVFPIVYTIQNDVASGVTANFVQAPTSCGGGGGQTALATNAAADDHDIEAPPWPVPVCDPTLENTANSCRLAEGGENDHLLGDRLFAEVSIDLQQYDIDTVCISSVIFSSRSSTSFTADIDDVGGGDFNLCGAKTGTKFHDVNANGLRDSGEDGLSGWTITLFSDDGNDTGTLDSGDTELTSTVTGSDGTYSFPSLIPGDYIVCEGAQAGWFQSTPTQSPGVCSSDTSFAPGGHAFTMGSAGHPGNDFGNYQQGTVSGVKFKDVDDNGAKDAGEPGLSGWTITAYSDSGTIGSLDGADTVAATTTTASGGAYSLDLAPGTYLVCEGTQAGWTQTAPSGSICAGGSGHSPGGYTVTVTSQGTFGNRDFGNAPLSTITVTFNPLTDFTMATQIVCKDGGGSGMTVGVVSNTDTVTTDEVTTGQSSVVCTVTFTDP